MFPQLSLEVANAFFWLSNIALILGGAIVLAGTIGVFWTSRERDRYADERISANEAKTAQANAEAATAQVRAKELEVSLESERVERLKLERQIQSRSLTESQMQLLSTKIRQAGWKEAEIMWYGNGEPEIYARQLASVFETAGVTVRVHNASLLISSAWGLYVIDTVNGDSTRLKAMLDDVGISSRSAAGEGIFEGKKHPTLYVGTRDDIGMPSDHGVPP